MAAKAYLDSDVVISSLISSKGAAYFLVTQQDLDLIVSDVSLAEQEKVIERLNLNKKQWDKLIKANINKIYLKKSQIFLKKFERYVSDPNDAHVVAGAVQAKAKFLITYNMKHFKTEIIKQDLKIILMTPATFLQYLRSLN